MNQFAEDILEIRTAGRVLQGSNLPFYVTLPFSLE